MSAASNPDMTRNHATLLSLAALSLCTTAHAQTILGFTPASAAHETAVEDKFKSIPTPDEERRQHRIFTQEPHIAGSKRNNELAEYIRDEWKKQGLEDVIIRRYDVYGTNPKSASLEMIAPTHYQATAARNSAPRRRRLQESRHQRRLARHVDLRRSHRARHLRPQRQSRRLRSAAQKRHQRQRQDRPRALLESLQLSRIQSAHRAARRRRRHARLQRSARRRLQKRQSRSRRPLGPRISHPARRHHLRLHGPRRSANSGMGLSPRRKAHSHRRSNLRAEDHGAAALLARRQAAARKHGRPRRPARLARRPADSSITSAATA